MPILKLVMNIPDHLNDQFVVPKKHQKQLNKVLNSLMEAYLANEYIRAYIDGDLDNVEQNIVSDMREELKNAFSGTEKAISFGSAVADVGTEVFKKGIEHQDKTDVDVARLTEGLVTTEDFNNKMDQMNELISQMQKTLASGAVVASPAPSMAVPSAFSAGSAVGVASGVVSAGDGLVAEKEKSEVVESTFAEEPVEEAQTVALPESQKEKTEEEMTEEAQEIAAFGQAFNFGGL